MSMLIIRHKVSDYGKWRPAFDSHSAMQKAAGLSNPRVLRSADDKSRSHRRADNVLPRVDLIIVGVGPVPSVAP